MDRPYTQVRCEHCHARLFDTDGKPARLPGQGIAVQVKCWRCKRLCVVRLAQPGADPNCAIIRQS